jgi:hypothetical protein
MVPAPTGWPGPTSSSWMRRCPQRGFSRARRTTRSRRSSSIRGRPGRWGMGPVPPDQPSVPGQPGGRGDDAVLPRFSWRRADQRGQYRSFRPGQARSTDLAAQYRYIVTQHQQFGDHRRLAAGGLRQPAEHPHRAQSQQSNKHVHYPAPPPPRNSSSHPVRRVLARHGRPSPASPALTPPRSTRRSLPTASRCGASGPVPRLGPADAADAPRPADRAHHVHPAAFIPQHESDASTVQVNRLDDQVALPKIQTDRRAAARRDGARHKQFRNGRAP